MKWGCRECDAFSTTFVRKDMVETMARRKTMTEAELLAEREKIDKQIEETRKKENEEIGALLKKTMGSLLPDSKSGRIAFFKEWKTYLEQKNTESSNDEHVVEV